MYIDRIPNRNSPPAILLRESHREDGKVKKRTIANLSSLPPDVIDGFAALLRGEKLVPVASLFKVERSLPSGHVDAVARMLERLGVAKLLGSSPGDESNIVLALIAQRIIMPSSKLGATRLWEDSTLGQTFGLCNVDVDDVYRALDWLLGRQSSIENKLAKRHLANGGMALYDLSSTWYTGHTCDLAKRGYSRDGKRGTLQINFGLLTDPAGCPVSISVYPGNTGDPTTVQPQVDKLRNNFRLSQIVLVGDRGMITGKQTAAMRDVEGLRWITALRSADIRQLVEGDHLQLELFDERNLFAITHDDFPGERLIACRNPALANYRETKRQELLNATCEALDSLIKRVNSGRIVDAGDIGIAVGKVIGRHKMAKHIKVCIEHAKLTYLVDSDSVAAESMLDGIYVIRTNVGDDFLDDASAVRAYKALTAVERDFRSIKTVDLDVRPIFHRDADRVRAHFLLCMLARYVVWHLERAWKPLTFQDQEPQPQPDPVLPRKPSANAKAKAAIRADADGNTIHSLRTLLEHLASKTRNFSTLTLPSGEKVPATTDTDPTPIQKRALQLIEDLPL